MQTSNPPPSKPPSQNSPQQGSQNSINQKIKDYDGYWNKLKTKEGIKIDGGEVKRLCNNPSNKHNLSKAWKLCCHKYTNCLSKGQFFIFLELISHKDLPQSLSPEIKNIIENIDKIVQSQIQK